MSERRNNLKIGIIGAGPTGLAAAYDLSKAGARVTVFEAGSQVGGLAAGFQDEGWDWTLEKFYHHWFQTDQSIIGLARDLGVYDKIIWPRPKTVIYHKGKWHTFDSFVTIPLFLLRHFPLTDFIRFGLAGVELRFSNNWKPLESITAAEWSRKQFGERLYDVLWRPMLVGKFGEENLDVVNMAWLWARLHTRTTRLGTFEGGFQAFMQTLADATVAQGVDLKLNTGARQIRQNPGGWTIETSGEPGSFDAVISTTSPQAMLRLAPELPAPYRDQLGGLQNLGAVVMVLTLKERLTDAYWHNLPKEAGFPFLALVEHTNYIDRSHYGGDHIIYCGDYLPAGHEYFKLDAEQLLERFMPGLQRFNPSFDRSWVKKVWLWKAEYAQPIPTLNHSAKLPAIRTPLNGLYFASMSQVYPWDRGTNYAVEMGRDLAAQVLREVKPTH